MPMFIGMTAKSVVERRVGEVLMGIGALMALSGAYVAQGWVGVLIASGFILILLGLGAYMREAK
jgi:hypothetical protein